MGRNLESQAKRIRQIQFQPISVVKAIYLVAGLPTMFMKLAVTRKIIINLALSAMLLLISACSSMSTTNRAVADANERWAILPINNLSQTAQADVQAQTLIETQLRKRGVATIDTYTPVKQVSLRNLLDPATDLKNSLEWAKLNYYRYGLTGSVNEWHYKAGADREPAVGISLKLVDLYSGDVVWQANAARTGWGHATLPTVGDKVIRELLQEVQLRGQTP
jgi:PBP1b-binding outer membrane lipoprotein LpoB